jgi:predicted HicB family RNase H-like nuclease
MAHKGYVGQTEFDDDAEVFCGTVVNANVHIAFQGRTVVELKKSFRDVVDSYLEGCRDQEVNEQGRSASAGESHALVLVARCATESLASRRSVAKSHDEGLK